ncbi:MAG TPA: peptidase domain-containing ABC transporter [Beijerinckiaceae bacterium]|nr:peptidase domain-containing ABC transporter [Beijerinckiaceae bacterium]
MTAIALLTPGDSQTDRSPTWLRCLTIIGRSHGLNLTISQVVQDNLLEDENITVQELMSCAKTAGLKSRLVHLDWSDLSHLNKALPVILKLKNGGGIIVTAVESHGALPFVVLRDPEAEEGSSITVDRIRLEEIWTGDVIVIRRQYALHDEEKPFGWGLMGTLLMRERRLMRDLLLGGLALAVLALVPMVFWRIITSSVLEYRAFNTFTVLCVGVSILFVMEGVLYYMRQYLVQIIAARVDTRVSEIIFDRLLNLQIDFFERSTVGEISHDISEAQKIRKFMNEQGFGTALDSISLFVLLPVMFAFSPLLTFIVLGIMGLAVLYLLLMLPAVRRATGEVIAAEVAKGTFLYQNLAGIRTVKSLALETRQRAMWDVLVVRASQALFHAGHISAYVQAVMKPLGQFAMSLPLAVGVYIAMTESNPVSVGDLFAFMIMIGRVQGPLMQMANLITQYDEARAAVGIVRKLMSQPQEEGRAGHGVRTPLQGNVEFARVKFKYQGANSYALDGVNFEVTTGCTLGIVGRSGSGKTTVTRLLQRLHSDYEGLIKIDGVDVREYDVAHLRRNLGVVLQENFLFSGSIRDNITAAKPHATFDEMVRAARLAGAEEFIDRLPRGYETYIYEGSPNLSGGQRQRLAIARALILDPRILILDEATSALDPDSEAIVNDNIRRIAQGRTVVVISHRLSSLVKSDAILVLERGKFEDIGTHEELLERCEIYRGLWLQQNRHLSNVQTTARPITRGPTRVS